MAIAYSEGIYSTLLFVTESSLVKLTLNTDMSKFHQPLIYDLAKSMPFEIRESQLQYTSLKDFKQEPIFKAKNQNFTWFFCLNSEDVIPYIVCESDAWVINASIVNLRTNDRKKLYENDKLVFDAPSSVIDLSESDKKIILIL